MQNHWGAQDMAQTLPEQTHAGVSQYGLHAAQRTGVSQYGLHAAQRAADSTPRNPATSFWLQQGRQTGVF